MSGMQGIKNRIKSVNDTGKITNAMYLIASTKLQKARRELTLSRPFFESLQKGIKHVFDNAENIESPYFYAEDKEHTLENGKYAVLVITGDKGMAGAYNQNVIKETEKLLEKHPDARLFVIGEFGRKAFAAKGIKYEEDFTYTAQRPTLKSSREISYILLDLYDRKEVDRICIIYTDMKSAMVEETIVDYVLPFCKESFTENDMTVSNTVFSYEPSPEAVLESITRSYLLGYIYSTLVDSFCAEQNARMSAMSAANDNAKNISNELQMLYNRMRQSEITNEIIEVSAGAKAQAMHRKKENDKH